jgi:Fe2+ or Zn2+ uptake regulation protein
VSMTELEHQRKSRQRGDILRILQEDYNSAMTSVSSLAGALDALGDAVSPDSLQFHLNYLADQELVRVTRNRDLPTWRSDRGAQSVAHFIRFAKLTAKGLTLLDGRIAADPMVLF